MAVLVEELKKLATNVDKSAFSPAEFEKDDDTNYHIDFIHSFSSLRARNYKIEECD